MLTRSKAHRYPGVAVRTLAHAGSYECLLALSGSHTQTELALAFPPTRSLMGALQDADGIPMP